MNRMIRMTAIFMMVFGCIVSVQGVQGEEEATPSNVSESSVKKDGGQEKPGTEESPEGEVTERSVPRITIPGIGGTQKPRPRITLPPKPKLQPKLRIPPGKQPPIPPKVEDQNLPFYVPDEVLVRLRPGMAIPPLTIEALGLQKVEPTSSGAIVFRILKQLESGLPLDPIMVATKLKQVAAVLYAQPNYIKNHLKTPDDELFPDQWHYFENGTDSSRSPGGIGLPHVWDQTLGNRIVVAVVDTGILTNHPEIAGSGNLLPGFDMIADPGRGNDGNGRDADPTDAGDGVAGGECGPDSKAGPDSWHGTHVAGTIGVGKTNNRVGISGVNWLVKVLPVRVLGKCGGTTRDINDGIRWAAGLPVPGIPLNPNPARIINMSLGAGNAKNPLPCIGDPDTQAVINEVVTKKGAIVVVSAGNAAVDASLASPASCNNVITVAASDARGHLAPYSNFGPLVEIMAPGGDRQRDDNFDGHPDGVLSLYHPALKFPADASIPLGYAFLNGTSMAAPHVSGVLALWLAVEPSLTNAELLKGLRDNAFPRTPAQCPFPCGTGLLNADLSSLIQSSPPPPTQQPPPVTQCEVKTSDIVHSLKIDIGENDSQTTSAKQSLLRMLSKGSLDERREASGMVKATETGLLAGIFQWNKAAVSKRAQTLSPPKGPWDLIPKGQLGMCLTEPTGQPPMIIYSRQEMPTSVLDDTLRKAWRQCGLPTPDPPCTYIKDMENKS